MKGSLESPPLPVVSRPQRQSDSKVADRSWLPPQTLIPARFFGDSTTFGEVQSILVIGRYLVVTDALSDPHIVVLDRQSGRLLHRLGRHGKGPHEFMAPNHLVIESEDPPVAKVYDFQNRRISHVRLDAEPAKAIVREELMDFGASLLQPISRPDGTVISNGLFPEHSLVISDSTRIISRIPGNPAFTRDEMPAQVGLRLLNRNFLAVAPNRSALALVYQFKPQIDFYDLDGKLLRSVQGPRTSTARYRLENDRFFWNDDNEMAYRGWLPAATRFSLYSVGASH